MVLACSSRSLSLRYPSLFVPYIPNPQHTMDDMHRCVTFTTSSTSVQSSLVSSELGSKYIEQNYNLIPLEYLQTFLGIYAKSHHDMSPSLQTYARATLPQPIHHDRRTQNCTLIAIFCRFIEILQKSTYLNKVSLFPLRLILVSHLRVFSGRCRTRDRTGRTQWNNPLGRTRRLCLDSSCGRRGMHGNLG